MNSINASSLFHFTRKFGTLKQILKNGLRYSYSVEYRPENFNENTYNKYSETSLILPMVCFCDIPLNRTFIHQKKYGHYCIGFNKQSLMDKLKGTLNPVSYYISDRAIKSLVSLYDYAENRMDFGVEQLKENPIDAFDKNNTFMQGCNLLEDLKYLLAYFKPCYNIDEKGNIANYIDEREWRAILKENRTNGCSWNLKCSNKLFDDNGNKKRISYEVARMNNNDINDNPYFFIKFSEEELISSLNYIILPNEDKVNKCINYILKSRELFGIKNMSKDLKLNIISKVSSFERIEKDF